MSVWKGMSMTQRAAAVDELLIVTMLPAPRGSRFSADYISVAWKRDPAANAA